MIGQTLSRMFEGTQVPMLVSMGLLIFLGVFAGAIAWVYRGGSKEFYEKLGRLPLEAEERSGK